VSGGADYSKEELTALSGVEVYDIRTGGWSLMPTEMTVARHRFAAAMHGDKLYAIGGEDHDARHTMEVLAPPSLFPWTPTHPHYLFPNSFKRIVYSLFCCFVRTNAIPYDVLFKIMWLLHWSAFFKHSALAYSVV
jgi:hypothetical protein